MTKKQRLIKNILILILLALVIDSFTGASLTPLSAHKRSERSANYGPSTIIKSQKVKGGVMYLCKYDKWYSLNTVRRGSLGLWFSGDQVHGQENDIKKAINFGLGTSQISENNYIGKFYGIVNDPNIKSVKLVITINGHLKTFEQNELYDNMFLITWDATLINYDYVRITGLDKDSNIIFEQAF